MKQEPSWQKARRLCRLSEEELSMAQELGLHPGALIRGRPPASGRKETWKDPPGVRIRKLYEKKKKKKEGPKHGKK